VRPAASLVAVDRHLGVGGRVVGGLEAADHRTRLPGKLGGRDVDRRLTEHPAQIEVDLRREEIAQAFPVPVVLGKSERRDHAADGDAVGDRRRVEAQDICSLPMGLAVDSTPPIIQWLNAA
jgi:hypothetical protein